MISTRKFVNSIVLTVLALLAPTGALADKVRSCTDLVTECQVSVAHHIFHLSANSKNTPDAVSTMPRANTGWSCF
jgi:hypothetical protein